LSIQPHGIGLSVAAPLSLNYPDCAVAASAPRCGAGYMVIGKLQEVGGK
jgi:hypothetical protein